MQVSSPPAATRSDWGGTVTEPASDARVTPTVVDVPARELALDEVLPELALDDAARELALAASPCSGGLESFAPQPTTASTTQASATDLTPSRIADARATAANLSSVAARW